MADGEFLPHVKSGRVRMLATAGPRRSRYHPDVPTFAEQRGVVPGSHGR